MKASEKKIQNWFTDLKDELHEGAQLFRSQSTEQKCQNNQKNYNNFRKSSKTFRKMVKICMFALNTTVGQI